MAILLPTQKLDLKGEGYSPLARFQYTGKLAPVKSDVRIPFSVRPTAMMEKYEIPLVNTIYEYEKRARQAEKNTLLKKGENEYQERLTELTSNYRQLKGQQAIDGYAQYQEDVKKLNEEYSEVFTKHKDMATEFELFRNNRNSNANIESRNYYNKTIFEVEDEELKARITNDANDLALNVGSPLESRYLENLQNSTLAWMAHNGKDPNSEEGQRLLRESGDKAVYAAVRYQLQTENIGGAQATLTRLAPYMNADTLLALQGSIKEKAIAISHRNRMEAEMRKQTALYGRAFNPAQLKQMRDDAFNAIKKEHPEMSDSEAMIEASYAVVQAQQRQKDSNDAQAVFENYVVDEIINSSPKGLDVEARTNPISKLTSRQKAMAISVYGSLEKANEGLISRLKSRDAYGVNTSLTSEQIGAMTPLDVTFAFNGKTNFSEAVADFETHNGQLPIEALTTLKSKFDEIDRARKDGTLYSKDSKYGIICQSLDANFNRTKKDSEKLADLNFMAQAVLPLIRQQLPKDYTDDDIRRATFAVKQTDFYKQKKNDLSLIKDLSEDIKNSIKKGGMLPPQYQGSDGEKLYEARVLGVINRKYRETGSMVPSQQSVIDEILSLNQTATTQKDVWIVDRKINTQPFEESSSPSAYIPRVGGNPNR